MLRSRSFALTGSSVAPGAARGPWRRRHSLALAPLLAGIVCALAPSVAAADACPSDDQSYTGSCGPMFAVPAWTDAGGWTDPSQYSTIQLADLNGDGKDELIGRSDAGIEIYRFDTTLGQWRPQVDANGFPQRLAEFRSFMPSSEGDPSNPDQAKFYSTIQAADIDGQPGEEILGRFEDGMHVYQYTPPQGGNQIDGGSWAKIGTGGPFSDSDGWGDPSRYLTIRTGDIDVSGPGKTELIGRSQSGLVGYEWNGSGWSPLPVRSGGAETQYPDNGCGLALSCYQLFRMARLCRPGSQNCPTARQAVVGRTGLGVNVESYDSAGGGSWSLLPGSADLQSTNFADRIFGDFFAASPDCPFAGGTSPSDCLGSSPSYFETFDAADLDADGVDEIFARGADGLRVKKLDVATGAWTALPTLTDLAGGAIELGIPGLWASIRTADLDGDRKEEVLALNVGAELQVWSYDPASKSWQRWQPSTVLVPTNNLEFDGYPYFATIRTGDVDGDGRDDVIARGPHGIRTWFYNRRGTGGWERYLPEGYPAFAGGQQNAFQALTGLAKTNGVIPDTAASVRDVWASENAPQASDLQQLHQGLVSIANCGGPQPGNPPRFQACSPPAGSSGFTAADWTTVVNQMLAENYAAGEVVAFFAQLESMRESLFIAEGAELPAIGADLGLQQAAGSTAGYDMQGLFSNILGLAALGLDDPPELGTALWVASYIVSMIPEASPTADDTFQTTYAGLQDQFAKIVTEVDKSLPVQSQQVRQDAGLLELVGQLRSRGTWDLDTIGMASAANQGFAAWVYQTLMPTVYDRYQITNCQYIQYSVDCSAPSGLGVIGGGQNFTMVGQRHQIDQYGAQQVPCVADQSGFDTCTWNLPPADLMNRIWGPVSSDCSYTPGQSQTAWTFGCSAGALDPRLSVGENRWGFPSYSGDPDPYQDETGGFTSSVSAARRAAGISSARVRPRGPIVLGRPRHGPRRAVRGRALFDADLRLPRGLRLAGARVRLKRLLRERRGRGELTLQRRPRPLVLRLRRAAGGRFTAATRGRRSVRIALRRGDRRERARLTLRTGAAAFRAPRACQALPASVALDTPPLYLESWLVISDGHRRHRILVEHHVRCVRDARGNISRLVYVRNRRHRLRSGLAVTLRGPTRVQPGTTVRYLARVHNRRRRGGERLLSSLWDVTISGAGRTTRLRELRAGRSRRVTLTLRVPRKARGRFCAQAVATAPGTRADLVRACSRVHAARAPEVTG